MADQSDGAIVKIVEKYGKDAPKYVEEYVKEMVQSIKKKVSFQKKFDDIFKRTLL